MLHAYIYMFISLKVLHKTTINYKAITINTLQFHLTLRLVENQKSNYHYVNENQKYSWYDYLLQLLFILIYVLHITTITYKAPLNKPMIGSSQFTVYILYFTHKNNVYNDLQKTTL